MKFHILIFNFILSTTPSDRVIYAYIALGKLKETILISTLSKKNYIIDSIFTFLGYIAEDFSFYALLWAEPVTPQDRNPIVISSSNFFSNNIDEISDQRFVFN